jgi:hypothetical protein
VMVLSSSTPVSAAVMAAEMVSYSRISPSRSHPGSTAGRSAGSRDSRRCPWRSPFGDDGLIVTVDVFNGILHVMIWQSRLRLIRSIMQATTWIFAAAEPDDEPSPFLCPQGDSTVSGSPALRIRQTELMTRTRGQ